jgi:hypothetical protein
MFEAARELFKPAAANGDQDLFLTPREVAIQGHRRELQVLCYRSHAHAAHPLGDERAQRRFQRTPTVLRQLGLGQCLTRH